jgi:two-component system sensor histidine kinase UhpB
MIAPLPARLDSPREIAVYRITQEALSNALRYAHATAISLRFGMNPEHSALQMEIRDNGVGFDMASIERGNGLSNMRERAALFAGEVSISTEPGKGTHIVLSIPLSQDQYL